MWCLLVLGPSRRTFSRAAALAVLATAVAVAITLAMTGSATDAPQGGPRMAEPARAPIERAGVGRRRDPVWPADGAPAQARELARERGGLVSFSAVGPGGREVSYRADRRYSAASVVKALILVAELRRLERGGLPLDDGTAEAMRAMITYSDNDAADTSYSRSGDEGLLSVARDAGMKDFTVAGHWGNAQITAADMASFMWRLDDLLDVPHGRYAGRLLASIVGSQRWGLPQVTTGEARLRFKGGWAPTDHGLVVHQAGLVELENERYAVAILTDGQPSMEHGIETIEGVAAELLRTDARPVRSDRRRSSRPGRGGSGS